MRTENSETLLQELIGDHFDETENVKTHGDWQPEDYDFEVELGSEIESWREKRPPVEIPKKLDRKISRLARYSVSESLQSNWLFSHTTRLILVMLLFFAIGLAYVLSLP